jgi:hypothetical protein
MPAINSYSTMNTMLKDSWSKFISKLVPDEHLLQREMPFRYVEDLGGRYILPLVTRLAQGSTFHAAGSAQNLNPAVSPTYPRFIVDAPALTYRDRVTYEMMRRAGNDTYYKNEVEPILQGLKVSHTGMCESMLLYGQAANGWGTVNAVAGNVLTIDTAEWALGLWLDRLGALFDVYTAGDVFVKTVELTNVDAANRQLTVDNGAGIVATNKLRPNSASLSANNEIKGIHSILTETTTMFGVPLATEPLLRGTQVPLGGNPLTFGRVLRAITQASYFGFAGKGMLLVNPLGYRDMINEMEGARNFGGDQYKVERMDRGVEVLQFYGPKGSVSIYGHDKVKEGFAYGMMMNTWEKVGVSEITLQNTVNVGGKSDYFLFPLQDANAYELRTYSQYSVVCRKPAANFVITGIVNAT